MTSFSTGWVGASAFLMLIVLAFFFISNDAHGRGRSQSTGVNLTGTSVLEAQFFTDLRDGRKTRWSLADAFFIASGIRQEGDLKRARAWIDDATSRAKEAIKKYASKEQQADHLLQWVHKHLFSSYQIQATDAVSMIRHGQYNCLSSCLIYGIIANRLGLTVTGIAVDRHAFCRVYAGKQARGKGWDVETTTSLGFNPGRDIKLSNAVVSVPRSRYRNRREMSLLELIGLLYTNHMGLNGAYPNLQDRLLAYQKASLFHPTEPTIQHNLIASHTQLISQNIERKNWDQAWYFLEQLRDLKLPKTSGSTKRIRLQKEHTETLMIELTKRHVDHVSAQGQDQYASEVLAGYQRAQPQLRDPLYFIEANLALSKARSTLANARNPSVFTVALEHYSKGLNYGKKAATSLDPSKNFERETRRLIQVMKSNHLALAKNLIVDLLNAGQKALAARLCEVALQYHPRDLDFKQYLQVSAAH